MKSPKNTSMILSTINESKEELAKAVRAAAISLMIFAATSTISIGVKYVQNKGPKPEVVIDSVIEDVPKEVMDFDFSKHKGAMPQINQLNLIQRDWMDLYGKLSISDEYLLQSKKDEDGYGIFKVDKRTGKDVSKKSIEQPLYNLLTFDDYVIALQPSEEKANGRFSSIVLYNRKGGGDSTVQRVYSHDRKIFSMVSNGDTIYFNDDRNVFRTSLSELLKEEKKFPQNVLSEQSGKLIDMNDDLFTYSTDKGLFQYNSVDGSSQTIKNYKPDIINHSVYVSSRGTLVYLKNEGTLLSETKLAYVNEEGRESVIKRSSPIQTFTVDSNDNIYFGEGRVLYMYSPLNDQVKEVDNLVGYIREIYISEDDSLYIVTDRGDLIVKEGGSNNE